MQVNGWWAMEWEDARFFDQARSVALPTRSLHWPEVTIGEMEMALIRG